MSLSRINSALTIENLCSQREGQYLERKGRRAKPSKIANELIGMLNAGGGTLVYGITDEGVIEDLSKVGDLLPRQPSNLEAYRKLVHDFIAPPANIELEEIYLENGELIFLYHVDQDYERLFQRKDNEDIYLRVADENRGALRREEVKKLEYDKSIRSFEEELCENFDPMDFEDSVCEKYRKATSYKGSFEELAIKRHLAIRQGEGVIYKKAAVLLFAKDPEKYIPNASVRYVRYEGTEQKPGSDFNVVKDQRFEANIPTLIRQLDAFMQASLRDYYFLDLKEGLFTRVPEFPKEAWLEGIVNALCHRSYNLQGNPVLIRHFDDRLEISSSGPLPAQVTVENITRERYARNVRIARALADFGYVRELNEGVPRIYSAMERFMLAKPEYTDSGNSVTLILRNKVTDHKETILRETFERIEELWGMLNKTQKEIIHMLFQQQEATLHEIAEFMGLSEQAIRNNLKQLDELKILERCSEKIRDKNALYRFKSG